MSKRIMVDMSATIIHHGHIRLLQKASEHGKVVVGLTSDDEIISKKGYQPELEYNHRKEILESIKYVDEVVEVSWLVNDETLKKYNIDLLVHGDDNSNDIQKEKLLIFPRTKGVSSTKIRENVLKTIAQKSSKNILLNPGPATTSYSVKLAQVVDDICPREQEFGDLMEEVSSELTNIVGSTNEYTTVLFAGSGTAVVEAVLSSVIPYDKKAIVINNGSYGARMCQILDSYDIEYIEFKSPATEAINLDKLEKEIQKHKTLSHLAIIHNETTTGLLNNLDDLGNIAKKYNLELIVDAMSSYAAIPINMEKQNISYLCASSNKNIQAMAGISFAIVSKKAIEKTKQIKARNFYFNLYAQYKNFISQHQMRFTPPVQTLYSLRQAIYEAKEEGIENRYKRYSKSWEVLTTRLKKLNLKYLVDDKIHSKIITSIFIPENIDFEDMHDYFYNLKYTIYPGKVDDFNTFRVANIGDIDYKNMEDFMDVFEEYLKLMD